MIEKEYINILLLCSFESTYVSQLWDNIKKYSSHIRVSLLTKDKAVQYYLNEIILDKDEHIYTYSSSSIRFWVETERILKKLPTFDIIHSLWMEKCWGCHARTLKSKTKYWFCSVGGSDLYRDSKKLLYKLYQINILRHSDWFSSENIGTKEMFIKVYGEKYKSIPHTINNFGVDILDAIRERNDLNVKVTKVVRVPQGKIVICCGYNANPAHQHLEMIQAFSRLPKEMIEKLFFIIPMTYYAVQDGYIDQVRDAIQKITNDFLVLEKFMNVEEMAEVVEATDIMIHVQTTDQMSSTMLAHMYNGNIVIAGTWLPYQSLTEQGIYFVGVDAVNVIDKILLEILGHYENYKRKCEDNADLVYAMSSWNVCAEKWIDVYEKLVQKAN